MDTTHDADPHSTHDPDGLLAELRAADPADAPVVAERLAAFLSRELDDGGREDV